MSQTPARSRPLTVLQVVRSIVLLEARRWLNRTPLLRKRGARSGTARKGAPAKVLLVFFAVIFLFNVASNALRIVHGVAVSAERASNPAVIWVPHHALLWLDQVLANDHALGNAYPERERRLREVFEFVAREELALDPADQPARVLELERAFFAHGRAAFRETEVATELFPSTRHWFHGEDPLPMLGPLALISALLALATMLFTIGGDRDIARTDARYEWWFTFPVPTRALLLARLLGSALINPFTWVLLAPFYTVVFWCSGSGPWLGALLGCCATLFVSLLGGCARVLFETGLRRLLSPRRISFAQAALEFAAGLPFLLVVAATTKAGPAYLVEYTPKLSALALYNPLSLPIAWLLPRPHPITGAAFALALALLAITGAIALGSSFLRDGLVTASEPLHGSRRRVLPVSGGERSFLHVVARHELLAIVREPNRIARVLLVPLVTVGVSAFSDPRFFRAIISEPEHASATAFGVGVLSLIGGGVTTLANEGAGLWLLYTAPRSLDGVLVRRAVFWSGVAAAITLLSLIAIAVIAESPRAVLSGHALLAVLGALLYGFISVPLGALGTDVLESSRAHRLQPFVPQLFMLLTGMFAFALYSPSLWTKFAQVALSSLFAFALWQKLADHTPYLLDPTEAPPPRIAVSDGIFAALAFFVLQGLIGLLCLRLGLSREAVLVFSFTGAGLLVTLLGMYALIRMGIARVHVAVGLWCERPRPLSAITSGLIAGVLTGGAAIAYTGLLAHMNWFPPDPGSEPSPELARWVGMLAVFAAPLCEEFIFRGILYRGFRRSLTPLHATLASAVVFAIVHPPLAFVPVFAMACASAIVFERSGLLLASVVTHMTYNAIVVGLAP